jgi:long-subunit fatty acid transport protein
MLLAPKAGPRPLLLRPRPTVAIAAALALTTLADDARADLFDMLGHDPGQAALAGSDVSFGESIGVLRSNPARLVAVPAGATLGLMAFAPHLHARVLPKPAGSDVPISIYDSTVGTGEGPQDRALPTRELPRRRGDTDLGTPRSYWTAGLVSHLGTKQFALGLLAQVPLGSSNAAAIATHYDDEREANFSNRLSFTRFGQWNRIASLVLGGAWQPLDWLSVGVSVQLAISATARFSEYIPNGSVQSYAQTSLGAQVSTAWQPVIGASVRPYDWLSFGLTWRDSSAIRVEGASDVTLWNFHESDGSTQLKRTKQSFPIVIGYDPMEIALGAGAKLGPVTTQVAAHWQQWSHFVDEHGNRPEDVVVPGTTDASALRFQDTIALSGSATVRATSHSDATVGLAWHPTPVPPQVGRTSFVDSDLVAVTLGTRYSFDVFDHPFTIAAAAQLWRMTSRTTYKDPKQLVDELPDGSRSIRSGRAMPEAKGLQTNNPGYPGYEASGTLLGGSLSISTPL